MIVPEVVTLCTVEHHDSVSGHQCSVEIHTGGGGYQVVYGGE